MEAISALGATNVNQDLRYPLLMDRGECEVAAGRDGNAEEVYRDALEQAAHIFGDSSIECASILGILSRLRGGEASTHALEEADITEDEAENEANKALSLMVNGVLSPVEVIELRCVGNIIFDIIVFDFYSWQ